MSTDRENREDSLPLPSQKLGDAASGAQPSTKPDLVATMSKLRASDKIGIDANRPVHPRTGEIQPQVADPAIVADTGAGWVRLNFVLRPWDHPHDGTLHAGRTWAATYRGLVSGFREKGLRVYGLIGCEAMPKIPKDEFRSPPPGGRPVHDWLEAYAEQFATIASMFKDEIQILESFNEPDDWHGQNRNWIHPAWFAIMLQRIYDEVRSDPDLEGIRLVSGPLQGLQANNNGPVHYLRATYQAGKERFGWGEEDVPFPFDGVGYHIYVKPGYTPLKTQQARAIRRTCRRYLGAMHRLIREEEGEDKPLFVSELGWTSNTDYQVVQRREAFQAHSLKAGLGIVLNDPLVELGFCFCTQDFRIETRDEYYGLYRMGELRDWNRKPAFYAFKALCERELDAHPQAELALALSDSDDETEELEAMEYQDGDASNQQVISAFYYAAADLRLRNRWALLTKAGLDLRRMAADRLGSYDGPPLEQLTGLTRREQNAVKARLGAAETRPEPPSLTAPMGSVTMETSAAQGLGSELSLDLAVALQEEVVTELKQLRGLLERILERSSAPRDVGPG